MNTNALLMLHPRRGISGASATAGLVASERRANEIEDIFSRFRPASELSRLNAAAGTWVQISAEMTQVLEYALGLHDATGGLFDPAILPDLERAGYDRTFEALPADRTASADAASSHPSFADIELSGRNVRIPESMRIDLGGIVKGWTADTLAETLGELGPCLVELGGDTAVNGVPPDSQGWSIGVQSAEKPGENMAVVEVATGGVATSGTEERKWKVDGVWVHHLIDPRTGKPANTDLLQVTAFGPSAMTAEVWAKAALIAGSAACGPLLQRRPDIELVLVPIDGVPVASPGVPLMTDAPSVA
jgi:thiamine biosynthesis lipoprotein